jgi:hypothetical protein
MQRIERIKIMLGLLKKLQSWLVMSAALVGLLVLLQGCTHRKVVQLGTHKVTVSRHGFEKRLHVNDQPSAPTLEYAGISTDGRDLKVSMQGDKITINGVDGKLRPGDSVLISDDGVAVNSMDYGESEKYLRANGSVSEATVRN